MSFGRSLSIIALAFALVFGAGHTANAQLFRTATASNVANQPATDNRTEDEAPDSPRASMRAFVDLCDRGRFEEASRYIDVPKGAEKRASELARKVSEVLQDRLWIDPSTLSPLAQGRKDDSLPAATEELGKIDSLKGHAFAIRIVRREGRSPEDEARWVFTQASVLGVETVHASLRGGWVRAHLPAPLLLQGPKTLAYWQWLAIPILGLACAVLGRLLTSVASAGAKRLTVRWDWSARVLPRLRRPVTTAFALGLFWSLVPWLTLTLRAEDFVERVLRALGYLAFFWALVRAVTVAGDLVAETAWSASRPNVRSMSSIGVRLGKVVVGAFALMVALSEVGYPVTTVVAGLGIGGVALALAAQKTVENLFGSLSILVDQPFSVGDTIRVDGVEGSVEIIGLRSTRLRTVERTLVILPNGKLADMRIESLGARDRIRFSTKLALRRDTEPAQIEALVVSLRQALAAHSLVRPAEALVRLSGIGEWSFDIEVAAPIETRDANEFAVAREELLLICVREVHKSGAKLAVPTRYVTRAPEG